MSRSTLARYIAPWKYRREQDRERVAALRQRDGDMCRRCRRPIRFDLPAGHDKAPKVEPVAAPTAAAEPEALENLCLCHGRCNAAGEDHTQEVMERLRPTREAELFAKARTKRRA